MGLHSCSANLQSIERANDVLPKLGRHHKHNRRRACHLGQLAPGSRVDGAEGVAALSVGLGCPTRLRYCSAGQLLRRQSWGRRPVAPRPRADGWRVARRAWPLLLDGAGPARYRRYLTLHKYKYSTSWGRAGPRTQTPAWRLNSGLLRAALDES